MTYACQNLVNLDSNESLLCQHQVKHDKLQFRAPTLAWWLAMCSKTGVFLVQISKIHKFKFFQYLVWQMLMNFGFEMVDTINILYLTPTLTTWVNRLWLKFDLARFHLYFQKIPKSFPNILVKHWRNILKWSKRL